MAGHSAEALWVLEQLTENAIRESRFLDASYYHWVLGTQYLEQSSADASFLDKFYQASLHADCYYAYDSIHRYLVTI